jgi:spore germination cell wall hydrolase CwlJ-like protein
MKTKTHKLVKSKSQTDVNAEDGKWIQSTHMHKGKLRRYLAKHYGLKPDEKISKALLNKAKSETKDPTVLHEINLAKTLKKMHKPTKSKEASSWADGGGIQAISSRLSLAGVKHVVVMASTETA